ncbi:WD repeat-containing protein 75 [Phthorimaea operculella]|nr:WD repeat-containing protein 75 [Phthorimaea operculella]
MGVKPYSENNVKPKYTFQRKAGRSIIERKPVFSPDGESVLVIVENVVRVYNIQTGDCARVLETETPVKELVAVQFPENENYYLYGCSDTGCLTTWTWDSGAVLRETNLEIPQNMKVLTFNLLDNNECFITAANDNSKHITFLLLSVKTGNLVHEYSEVNAVYNEDMVSVALGHCNGDRFAAIANGTPRLFIQNLNKPHISQHIVNSNVIRILSVATHKSENVLAITDALGRAFCYKGNFFGKNLAKERLHWHSLPAMAVCFSMQGSYLYTGGMEQVLVKWTLSHLANKADDRMYLPRLPGMVKHITSSNSHVAVALSNNSIVVANAQMKVVSTILECGGLSPVARALGFPLVFHQRLGGLLLGGRTGHLQLYSTATDKVLFNVDITGQNRIPPLRNNLLPLDTEVTCAAISGNGSWLVTSEYRNDGVSYPEERLKFWDFQKKNTSPFVLNTIVNLSHGGCRVVSLTLSERAEFCVSAGADQKFRIWKREKTSQTHRKKESWCCLTACYYSSGIAQSLAHGILNNYKNGKVPPKDKEYPYVYACQGKNDVIKKIMNIHKEQSIVDETVVDAGFKSNEEFDMGGVAISQDGSLIAAWFGSKLTLWDSHLCNLRTTLSHPALRPKGVLVKFGYKDAAHYLVCTTEHSLAVWSLLSLSVKWLVPISATCLTADPLSNRMAVITTNNDVFVFTPHSSTPILSHKRLLNPETGVFKQCAFGDCSEDNIRLYVVRNDSEIYCLEPEQSAEGRLEVMSRRNLPVSGFGALLAQQRESDVRVASGEGASANAPRPAIAEFLSAAPHMIPPVSLLCTSFLRHLAGHDDKAEPSADPEDPMEIDQSSSEDEDEGPRPTGPYAPKPAQLWTPNYEKIKEKRLQRIAKEPLLDLHEATDVFGV